MNTDRKMIKIHSDNYINDAAFSAAPQAEPERQLYFISQLSHYFGEAFSDAEGSLKSTPLASVVTFGCQMNARDSEKLTGILQEIGFSMTEDELHADFVIFNTCTVRENANEHLYGRLGRLKGAKK